MIKLTENKKEILQLNLGCGLSAPEDWLNIDASMTARLSKIKWLYKLLSRICKVDEVSWPQNVKIIDVRKGLPFKDGTVKNIFSSHMLEHLSLEDCGFVIKECFRVLRPEGVLRIIVPDLYQIAKQYVHDVEYQPGYKHGHVFLKNLDMFYVGSHNGIEHLLRSIFGHGRHLYMYDRWSLRFLLETHGFRNIEEKEFGKSLITNIHLVENEGRHEKSICLEGVKV